MALHSPAGPSMAAIDSPAGPLMAINKLCRRWSGRTGCGGTIGAVTGPMGLEYGKWSLVHLHL